MTFWEEVADKAKTGAQKIQQVTLETVDKVKLKAKISKLNSEVTKCYTEIGKLVYDERCGDTVVDYGEKISELLSKITEAKTEISECEQQLEEI